ncbi:PINIT domain-containing protein [Terfezia claveryi]|nr:PINIT domain-containing protein [Terfezia claveryi]
MATQTPNAREGPSTAALINYVQQKLIVRQLQLVLKSSGLPSSGVKKTLQERLIDRIVELSRNNEAEALEKLKGIIYKPDSSLPPLPVPPVVGRSNDYGSSPTTNGFGSMDRLHFKPSPFYTILEPLCAATQVPVMNHHRNTVKTRITLNEQQLNAIITKGAKVMLYCGQIEAPTLVGVTKLDIGFPQQVEVKVNEQIVPASQLKGLKNKPGSTRPPDITQMLHKSLTHINDIAITYALTTKKYAFVLNLVNVISAEKLVQDLKKNNHRISKQSVIDDMVKRNEDSDLMATSSVMSLKCPLSTLRIEIPVRSRVCTHVQCFDALSYLLLQQQAPTWQCPTCNKPVPYEMLVIDSYVQTILDSTPKNVDSVTVDPDGNWSVASQRSPSADLGPNSDEEEDVIEIQDSRPVRKFDTPSQVGTPNNRGNSQDTTHRSSSKRPISQVIDLTLSDDDDEPPRPAKRHNTSTQTQPHNGHNGHNGYNGYQRVSLTLPHIGRTSDSVKH